MSQTKGSRPSKRWYFVPTGRLPKKNPFAYEDIFSISGANPNIAKLNPDVAGVFMGEIITKLTIFSHTVVASISYNCLAC